MTLTKQFTTLGLLATLAAASCAPTLADGNSRQKDKNNMRNLAIAGAAVAGYGLFSHNNAATLLGAAGAGLAGNQYEKDRKQQSQDNNYGYYGNDNRRYYRNGYGSDGYNRDGYNNNGYNRDGYNRDGYNRDGYNRDGYNRDGYNRDGYNRDTRYGNDSSNGNDGSRWNDNRGNDDNQRYNGRQYKHHGKGWYKNHGQDGDNRD